MTFPSIIGTETEYGIAIKNVKEQDPVGASMLVVNSYKDRDAERVTWDYDQELSLIHI